MQRIKGDGMLIVEIGSRSCAPCAAIRRKLDDFLNENPAIEGRYLSVEAHPEVAGALHVLSVPTLILFIDGKRYLSVSGYFSLENFLEKTRRYTKIRSQDAPAG